jgi:hypothetical protein
MLAAAAPDQDVYFCMSVKSAYETKNPRSHWERRGFLYLAKQLLETCSWW